MATKREGYLVIHEEIELTQRGLTVRAYTIRTEALAITSKLRCSNDRRLSDR